MTTFFEMIDAVEENNRMHDANWCDWVGVKHLEDTYGKLEVEEEDHLEYAIALLDSLIISDGANVKQFKDIWQIIKYGAPFSRQGE